ncbi:SpvB/TcaC N-terminal domain-containing protein [Chondromyces crocatus]|uniref:Toxin n=1 Tax=Chondromyces crocatus TaxID=52 RepID=A0A0K1ERU7_CHOCO|nr:SpvB/TcaC N-terminal domain-containing protein [Chondromyces crocatus]AKT43566.1 toxin [Chondromyces crocatus]
MNPRRTRDDVQDQAAPSAAASSGSKEGGERAEASPPRGLTPVAAPSPSLPKGGGAIRGIGEKFSVSPATGTGSLTVPIAVSPGRAGAQPDLGLSYDSSTGNGLFGAGWQLSAPRITRKTDKGLPRYEDALESDTFVLSGAEDLVPVPDEHGALTPEIDGEESVLRYRPRTEGLFARIERRTNTTTGRTYWTVTTRDNITSLYGKADEGRIADPKNARRVFAWLLEETRDDRGHVTTYEYKAEDLAGASQAATYEAHRHAGLSPEANRHLKRIRYGNVTPGDDETMLFEVVFDYGEHDEAVPTPEEVQPWSRRQDPFSTYRAGFEVRTARLCRRVLVFHHMAELDPEATSSAPGDFAPTLVRSTDFVYDDNPVLTKLTAVTHSGYVRESNGSGYQKKSFPPVEFGYSEPELDTTVRFLDKESVRDLAGALQGSTQWVDLDGEGLPGLLVRQGSALLYKRNLGAGQLGPARALPSRPSLAASGLQVLDLDADGQKEMVFFERPVAGYFDRTEEEAWAPFRAFPAQPVIDWSDPNLQFVDLNGDGSDDVLIARGTTLVWYPSRAKGGFEPPVTLAAPRDGERGAALLFTDGHHTVFLADMSGDGLSDLVRVTNGNVCYWPNLGHGRFGAKVILHGAPWFDHADKFDPRRVRLADVDGSGTTDVLYVRGDGIWWYPNQAGNGLGTGVKFPSMPDHSLHSTLAVLDLLGTGTGCLVWSSPLPGFAAAPLRYMDLLAGKKPHLMTSVKNNLGLETRLQYAPSTKFFLQDRAAGTPWVTKLPFPVHVVERVESYDHVSRVRFASEYRYHHGYFDGEEREFRGFGLVEQVDTEAFSAARGVGLFPEVTPVNGELPQPPVLTKTWLHTGAWRKGAEISQQYEKEYYQGESGGGGGGLVEEPRLPDTILPAGLTPDEMRQACRALRGQTLRQEVYALDGSEAETRPYSVVESSHAVRREQAMRGETPGVFLVSPREAISLYYERHEDAEGRLDPRVTHAFTLEVDAFGVARASVAVAYPRRHGPSTVAAQNELHVTLTEMEVVHLANASDGYRLGIPIATRTYELHGLTTPTGVYAFEDVVTAVAEARGKAARAYEDWPPSGGSPMPSLPERRLIEDMRVRYQDSDNLPAPLALGVVDVHALPYESYQLALTQGQIDTTYNDGSTRVTSGILLEGGYVQLPDEAGWWIPSGRQIFDAAKFFLPTSVLNPWGTVSTVEYDDYHLLVERTEDALGNEVVVTNDYRVLSPVMITEPNGNRGAVQLDALGMVVATAVMGKLGSLDGDTLDDPTTTLEIDLFRYMNTGKPSVIHARARETHGDPNTRWQEIYTYSDGSGREIMRKLQAAPGLAPLLDEHGHPVLGLDGKPEMATADPRWVGNGRTVVDNKGNPIKQYEPYFSSTFEFEDDEVLMHWGVTPVLRYDPLGRLVRTDFPDGTCARVEFSPWSQTSWDANDTVLDPGNLWFAARQPGATPTPSAADQRAATLAAAHAGTPAVVHVDPLGRAVVGVADLGGGTKLLTTTTLDLEGNPRIITDARGNDCMVYTFDVAGRKVHQHSIDAGTRWMLSDVLGSPLRGWDSRGHTLRTTYDVLRRPTGLWVQQGIDPEVLAERTVYGEGVPSAATLNLRGKVYQQYDGAGLVTSDGFDFKGNLLGSTRTLAVDYQNQLDWDATPAPALEVETFTSTTAYDALNRPVSTTTPDQSETRPTYNEAGQLEAVDVRLRDAPTPTSFVDDIAYSAKGQRERITYGNGIITEYTHDPLTFRLTRLKSTRVADSVVLQDLHYTHDPVGNIILIDDKAQQSLYHNSQLVEPVSRYEYDALYRLIHAEGREHAGQNANIQQDAEGFPLVQSAHPNDPQALRAYTESYDYDEVGNLLTMAHQAVGGGWSRHYEIDDDSNRLLSTSLPGDLSSGPYSAHYSYDPHGNMTSMPHLVSIVWDFENQQREVDLGGGGIAYYVYDATGKRVRKAWEHNGIIEERIYLGGYELYRRREGVNANLVLERETLHVRDDDRRIAMVETETVEASAAVPLPQSRIRCQLENHLGSAALELDETGMVISYEEYHPYGTTAYWSAPSGIEVSLKRYRYTRKERDKETGLYYHGARFYACWLGRWISTDPAGVEYGPNLYEYVKANPVRFHDPSGMSPEDDVPDYGLEFMQRLVVAQAVESGIKPPTAEEQKAQQAAQSQARAQKAVTSRTTAPVGLRALQQMAPSTQNSVFVQGSHLSGALNAGTAVGLAGAVAGATGAGAVVAFGPSTVTAIGLGVARVSPIVGRVGAGIMRARSAVAQGGTKVGQLGARYRQQIEQALDGMLEAAQQGAGPLEALAGAGIGGGAGVVGGGLKGQGGRLLDEIGDVLSLMVGRGSGGTSKPAAIGASARTVIDDVIEETMRGKGNITSRYTLTVNEALEAGERWVGKGYKEIGVPGSGVFRSADGTRQFRIDPTSVAGTHDPWVKHIHLEVLDKNGRKAATNNHIEFKE